MNKKKCWVFILCIFLWDIEEFKTKIKLFLPLNVFSLRQAYFSGIMCAFIYSTHIVMMKPQIYKLHHKNFPQQGSRTSVSAKPNLLISFSLLQSLLSNHRICYTHRRKCYRIMLILLQVKLPQLIIWWAADGKTTVKSTAKQVDILHLLSCFFLYLEHLTQRAVV